MWVRKRRRLWRYENVGGGGGGEAGGEFVLLRGPRLS